MLTLWSARETEALHLTAIILTLVAIESCFLIDTLMQELSTFLSTVKPEVRAPVITPLGPDLIEGRDVIAGVGETLSETVWSKGNQTCLRVDEIHLLRTLLLSAPEASETSKAALPGFWCILLGLDTVQNTLGLSFVIDARIVTPTVRSEDQGCNKI